MEILEIRSSQDLTTKSPETRRPGAHSYSVNCSQFNAMRRDWQRERVNRDPTLGLMTLGFERIYITEAEIKQVADAIQSTHPLLVLT